MKNLQNLQLEELTIEEQVNTEGGIIPYVVAGLALYEAGKAVGEFAYWISH